MAKNEIVDAIKQICEEKNISYESVIDTIQQALAAAYRKDFGEKNQNIKCEFFPETGKIRAFDVKTVVEDLPGEEEIDQEGDKKIEDGGEKEITEIKKYNEKLRNKEIKKLRDDDEEEIKDGDSGGKDKTKADESMKKESKGKEEPSTEVADEPEERKFNPRTEIQLTDAKKIKKTAKAGDEIRTELEIPDEFGRMAAQTAKQVIIQRLREVERKMLYQEYKGKEGQVLNGIVQRQEGRLVLVDLGNVTAVLVADQQIQGENYNSGQRYRFYVVEVRESSRGPEIIVSRTHPEIVRQLFAIEVPEIASAAVEIKAISREAGSRSKVAVATDQASIDPIGSCVGQRGTRIQTIINELGGEKIDIIRYDDDLAKFIANALSPAKVVSVEVDEKSRIAKVKVRPDQLSLAIGKEGQNVRLAAKLTGWKIDIGEAGVAGGKAEDEAIKKEGGGGKGEEGEKEIKKLRKLEIKDEVGDKSGGGKNDGDKVNKSDEEKDKGDRSDARSGTEGVKGKGEKGEKE